MAKLIPLQDFVDKKSIIRNRIDRIRNELCYEKEAAPLDEILTQEFSTLRVLIVDSSIKDPQLCVKFIGNTQCEYSIQLCRGKWVEQPGHI